MPSSSSPFHILFSNKTLMDTQVEPPFLGSKNVHSTIDTSRPFRSVKEAVAIFGERILAGDLYTTKTLIITNSNHSPPPPPPPKTPFLPPPATSMLPPPTTTLTVSPRRESVSTVLQKLESELENTKKELKLLQERESETEIALASLNAELHRNMSKIAEAEATAAGASSSRAIVVFEGKKNHDDEIWEEKDSADENFARTTSKSLAHMLSIDDEEGYFGYNYIKKQKKMMKKKPIIPLFGNVFSRKKSTSRKNLD